MSSDLGLPSDTAGATGPVWGDVLQDANWARFGAVVGHLRAWTMQLGSPARDWPLDVIDARSWESRGICSSLGTRGKISLSLGVHTAQVLHSHGLHSLALFYGLRAQPVSGVYRAGLLELGWFSGYPHQSILLPTSCYATQRIC